MLRRAMSESAAMASAYRAVGSCTESLGSESGDVGGDAEIDQLPAVIVVAGADEEEGEATAAGAETQASPEKRRRTERRLPPALPRASEAFMRAERRGGRLILTEVVRPAERPREVFRASRADGRLLLRFAEDGPDGHEERGAPAPGSETSTESNGAETSGVVVGGGWCNCNGAVGFRQATAGGAGRHVEVGAVMGI